MYNNFLNYKIEVSFCQQHLRGWTNRQTDISTRGVGGGWKREGGISISIDSVDILIANRGEFVLFVGKS